MRKEEISNKIFQIVRKIVTNEETLNLKYDDDIRYMLDSIQFVTLIVEIESTFNVEVRDEDFEIEKLGSIEKITELILSYM